MDYSPLGGFMGAFYWPDIEPISPQAVCKAVLSDGHRTFGLDQVRDGASNTLILFELAG